VHAHLSDKDHRRHRFSILFFWQQRRRCGIRVDGDLMNRWRAIYMRPAVSRSGVAPAGRIANPLIAAGPRRSRHLINSDFLPFCIQAFLFVDGVLEPHAAGYLPDPIVCLIRLISTSPCVSTINAPSRSKRP
jgi:hypothetical protein